MNAFSTSSMLLRFGLKRSAYESSVVTSARFCEITVAKETL